MTITAFVASQNNQHIFAGDQNGILYAFSLGRIFYEHFTRSREFQKNNEVYTFTARWKVSEQEITHLIMYQDALIIGTKTELYKLETKNLYQILDELDKAQTKNKDLIDLTEIVQQGVIEKIVALKGADFAITCLLLVENTLYIGSAGGTLSVMDLERDELQLIIDVIGVANDVIMCMVPITKNPVSSITRISEKEIVIGTSLGLLLLYDVIDKKYNAVLKFIPQDQYLSPVLKTVYDPEYCQLISLHEDYTCIWNMVILKNTKIIETQGLSDITISDQYLLTATDKSHIECIYIGKEEKTNYEIQTSQRIVLEFLKLDEKATEILLARGDTPFIDVYRQRGYQFTLASI